MFCCLIVCMEMQLLFIAKKKFGMKIQVLPKLMMIVLLVLKIGRARLKVAKGNQNHFTKVSKVSTLSMIENEIKINFEDFKELAKAYYYKLDWIDPWTGVKVFDSLFSHQNGKSKLS